MPGLENAAAAFEKELGGSTSSQETTPHETMGVEDLFSNMGQLEVDDDSPATAGGDAEDDAKRQEEPRQRKAKVKAEAEELDPEAELYGPDDEEEGDEDGEDDEDEDEDEGEGGEYISEEEFETLRDRKVTVTVDGAEKDVPLSEALDGYIRLETFHQRMNEVDEAQKAIDAEVGNIQQSRAKYVDMLAEAQEMMEAILPPEPDWDKLFAEKPQQARQIQKSYLEMKGKIDEIKGKRQAALHEGSQQYVERMKQYKDLESKKFDASNPNWVGEEGQKRKLKDLQSMVRTARSLGFSDTEINQVMDSRMLGILLRASKYDRMMAARTSKKPLARGKQLTNSGAGKGKTRTAPRGVDRAQKQLQRTGSVHDAAPVFAAIINRG